MYTTRSAAECACTEHSEYTTQLERALTQLRDAESALSMAHTELKQCDDRTQDAWSSTTTHTMNVAN